MGGQLPLWRTMGHRLSLHCPSIPVGNHCSKSPGRTDTPCSLLRFPEPRSVRLQTPKAGAQGRSTRHTSCPALGWRLGRWATQMMGDMRIITEVCCRGRLPVLALPSGLAAQTTWAEGLRNVSGHRATTRARAWFQNLLREGTFAEQGAGRAGSARALPSAPGVRREDTRLAEGGCPVASSSWGPCLCSGFCHCLWPFPWKP